MNYVHNKVDVIRAFIFVQTELDGFAKAINAKAIAEGVKQQLEDKDALGIVEVEVFTDLSKNETLEIFSGIKEDSVKFTEENNCRLGLFFVSIGFQCDVDQNSELLSSLDAPLSDTTMAHHYAITTEGKMINYPQLVADITSHPSIAAVLIHELDYEIY